MNRTFWGSDFELLDLSDEGDADLIFDLIPAIKLMCLAVENGERILGGEIIVKEPNGKYTVSYNNWFSESVDPKETLMTALDYLALIVENDPKIDWKVALVVSNCS